MTNEVTWYGKYTDGGEWPDWFRDGVESGRLAPGRDKSLAIQTIRGTIFAEVGDVVKRLANGEFMRYPGEGPK